MQELVSIIVPVYNVENYLEDCVQSLRNQTYKNIEIILVDDESPDNCPAMCDAYAREDDRIRVIHKKNEGQGPARNEGVKKATGKYLLFVDSDDHIALDLVEKTLVQAEKHQCELVIFDYAYVEGEREEIRTMDLPAEKVISVNVVPALLFSATSPCTKLYRRDFFIESKSWFPGGVYYEDLAISAGLLTKAKRVYYIKEPFYFYMRREASTMTGKKYEKQVRDKKTVVDGILADYKDAGLYEKYCEELEYLVFANAYFEPSKSMVLEGESGKYLGMLRDYMYKTVPKIHENKYVKSLGKKDKLHLWILDHKQYWMMRVLSKMRHKLLG